MLGDTLVLATRNAGKVRELTDLLTGRNITLRLITDFTDHEPVEDGGSYLANATIKAKAAAAASGLPSLADDAGIEFDALPDRFGVETAPDAASFGGWEVAAAHVADLIAAGAPDTARHCVTYVLAQPDEGLITAEGVTEGRFVFPKRGDEWGFNPYFIPHDQTAGEALTYSEIKDRYGLVRKNALSARGRAMTALLAKLGL